MTSSQVEEAEMTRKKKKGSHRALPPRAPSHPAPPRVPSLSEPSPSLRPHRSAAVGGTNEAGSRKGGGRRQERRAAAAVCAVFVVAGSLAAAVVDKSSCRHHLSISVDGGQPLGRAEEKRQNRAQPPPLLPPRNPDVPLVAGRRCGCCRR
ncbi:uncharacterized protein DS421_10g300620 [Arachis hypogaea]|nr:uncharacterized protein LOC114924611 [Arachis hypogaea]QHO16089.1 uncharacterized protein DS421_10g300620 [Arachis hypogaea]